jgi:translation elongation factor EF-G
MFRKVSNADLMSRLVNLENMIDIVNIKIDSQSNLLQGCCDCKSREVLVYKELKDYIEDKFAELTTGIMVELNNNKEINSNMHLETLKICDDVFEKYKVDIMNNLQAIITNISISNITGGDNSEFCTTFIIDKLKDEFSIYKTGIDVKLADLNNLLNKLTQETCNRFTNVDKKLDSMYFENEVIKHQLKLEDDIRNTIEEVNNLNNIIVCAISQIDKFIG